MYGSNPQQPMMPQSPPMGMGSPMDSGMLLRMLLGSTGAQEPMSPVGPPPAMSAEEFSALLQSILGMSGQSGMSPMGGMPMGLGG